MRSKSNVLLYNITAVVIGLVISGLLLLFMKVNPLDVCGQALGKIVTDQYNLGEILVKATPLIFTSLAFAFTYNANLFNIGAQGQFTMGAIIAVALSLGLQDSLPTWLLLLLVLLGSFTGGAAVGGLIGGAKAKFHANEFLVSMMSTYVITNFMDYLLRTSLQETKAEYMQTDAISSSAYLPNIIPGTRVHLGFLIAVAAAVAARIQQEPGAAVRPEFHFLLKGRQGFITVRPQYADHLFRTDAARAVQGLGAVKLGEFQPGRFHDVHDFLRVLVHEDSHAADQRGVQGCGA